ncbi:MAG: 16S rRNA (guanine(527)-N(7))-methyltransferase RsmG [Acidiferrobacterales bacterium]
MLTKMIRRGAADMGLVLPDSAARKLADYIILLQKWNRVYNLTAVRDPEQMVSRHVLDSLSVVPFLRAHRVLDIGTGAGLPGIPLALACPSLEFVLLDSNAKKTRFVTQALAELGLANASVVLDRVEKLQSAGKFDTLISRALGGIADMLAGAAHLSAPGGHFLAMKGVYPQEELSALPPGYRVLAVNALRVPGLEGKRHLAILAAAAQTESG